MRALHFIVITVLFLLYSSIVFALYTADSDKGRYDIITSIENTQKNFDYETSQEIPLLASLVQDWNRISSNIRIQLENQRQFSNEETLLFLKILVGKFTEQYSATTHNHLQLFNHPFYSSSQPPCQYYVFAMRRILD